MGIKALNHTSSNKVNQKIEFRKKSWSFELQDVVSSQRSPMLNLYQEEKCRRIECEKQAERLVKINLEN